MLKRENRLKKNKHFNYIYKNGSSVGTKFIKLFFIKTKVRPFKVGFSVNNKIGKAVVRNKLKRQMKEIFASFLASLDKRYNYIFVVKEGLQEKTFLELKECMFDVIKKAGLLNEQNSKNSTVSV